MGRTSTPMIKLTCLLKRKEGMTPAEFQDYWKNHHGPVIASSRCGSHVIRYEQNPRPLGDYRGGDDRSEQVALAAAYPLAWLRFQGASTVYTDLQEAGASSGNSFVGSDHYPIFGDYNIMPPPFVLTLPGYVTNQNF